MTLNEALYYSNNNVFLNACYEYGIETCMLFLATIFQKKTSDFFPSSILGATKCGISLAELALAYDKFFSQVQLDPAQIRCVSILNKVLVDRYQIEIENAFLKTGTTNNGKERFAILKNPELTFALLRNEYDPADSKDAGFSRIIKRLAHKFFRNKTDYKWT